MIKQRINKIINRIILVIRFFFKSKALVLIYHRVINLSNDPQELSVSLENFEKQMILLKSKYKIKPLQTLISDLKMKKLTNKTISITFDDGYSDNYLYALPILEKLQIPATFFVSTNYIGKNDEYWWDKLEAIILLNNILPDKLELQIGDKNFKWNNCNKIKNEIYFELLNLLKQNSFEVITNVINQLLIWAGNNTEIRRDFRPMSNEELIKLSNSKFVEIGAHTLNHCVLSKENHETQKKEIEGSKKFLEKLIQRKINSFSYPFGEFEHYTKLTTHFVKFSGFNCGISNNQNLVLTNINSYEIPRFLIRNWDDKKFEKKIKRMFIYGPE